MRVLPLRLFRVLLLLCLPLPGLVRADGLVIDKIYHPYVDALEKELEFRATAQDRQPGLETPAQLYQLALGRSFGPRWFGELYVIGARSRDGNVDVEAYELELKRQLTEQGEFAADWGLLFEYESESEEDIQEVTVGILAEREFGRWSGTANLLVIGEWGGAIRDELETALGLQARYRHSPLFEPALELYAGQDSRGLGPALLGAVNVGTRKTLRWEAGVIFGLDDKSPDTTFRLLLEFEF